MKKANSNSAGKGMSEGMAIVLAVLVITVGLIGGYYLIKLIMDFFLPGFFS